MSYEQYWDESPYLVKAYRKAHELYIEQKNQEMHMQGFYNYMAFKAVIDAFSYGLNQCKGQKPEPYLQFPIAITEREKEEERKRAITKTEQWFGNQK